MTKKDKKWMVILICVLLIFCISGVGCKFIVHEENQNKRISKLEKEIESLYGEIEKLQFDIDELSQDILYYKNGNFEWPEDAFNYLAIGNSITKHGLTEYWWNEIGMAATSEDKDYVHLITAELEKQKGEVCKYAFSLYVWEIQAKDRAETLELLDTYLDERLDLVTIQLSENVSDMSTYESDYEELIHYIQLKAPEAQIIIIDDFWDEGAKSIQKKEAANNVGVQFVSLTEIKGKSEYQCGLGTVVFDSEGNENIVEHPGVALHPGDKGMEYIANAVIQVIEW